MKRLFCILCSLMMLTVLSLPAAGQEKQAPRMIIKDGIYDGGAVNEGEVIKHTFLIRNEGNATLRILDVKPG